MGGKALKQKGFDTVRLSTDELENKYHQVKTVFERYGIITHNVNFYTNKQTHGDLDVLVNITPNTRVSFEQIIKENFTSKCILRNGAVVSFELDNFQVDLIPVSHKNWGVAKTFFDYDPTGNLMGKVAHRFGLKYGFCGLVYPFRNFNGRNSVDITVSLDNAQIFDFLGYSYEKYNKGFKSLEDVFEYIINGRYFNNQIFDFEKLTHTDRKRNLRRDTYQQFLKYIKENDTKSNFVFNTKDSYFDYIDSFFPEAKLKETFQKLKQEDDLNKVCAEKFNGHIIMNNFPELYGRELGDAITLFKKSLPNYKEFILTHTEDEILEHFTKIYQS